MSAEERIAELTARVATLEAAIKTGGIAPVATTNDADYPFLAKLSGDDLIAAKALITENATLHKQVAELNETLEAKNFRIKHMKEALDKYVK
ncbi:hypothetical protein TVAG_154460 [Trichomonas vaginalis G3]|uniref:Uncharacterized protein n=1 Tax=Trichomonas vaginalis (strain ATCC PRA-98 / G3) TaxID=412133 RepID=A2E452_TRIV3|nr:hypothetical protein TVAGG3_0703160 [Trichomonas vaginalis G3]EAY12595.1 hypothetical protein TVAG_154460 [Trichomonas vaginalis G3]KAI5509376.1 hypothetical protein TVAGG3_0703160 [Trichomonas vaginalis G3]|eukprot:XP_001324818.1 hypothetical protein [Trichomonas vaginalis G3]